MKKLVIAICTMLALSVVSHTTLSQAADKKQTHHVGLHDRLLDFTDVRVIDGDMKVPLDEIAKVLYIPLEQEIGITYIRKRGIEISYNEVTQQTAKDGIEITWSPIVSVDGKLFISVKYIARETGFKTEYIKQLQTLRIYRDNYAHMSHVDYEKMLHQLLVYALIRSQ